MQKKPQSKSPPKKVERSQLPLPKALSKPATKHYLDELDRVVRRQAETIGKDHPDTHHGTRNELQEQEHLAIEAVQFLANNGRLPTGWSFAPAADLGENTSIVRLVRPPANIVERIRAEKAELRRNIAEALFLLHREAATIKEKLLIYADPTAAADVEIIRTRDYLTLAGKPEPKMLPR